jgi:hypothetical protein
MAVEGLNLKAKLTIRKAYGFKSLKCLQVALYQHAWRFAGTTMSSQNLLKTQEILHRDLQGKDPSAAIPGSSYCACAS